MTTSLERILADEPLPRFARVRQALDAPRLDAIPERILAQLDQPAHQGLVKPGQRIGITVGSRGIANMPLIVRTLADWVREHDATPVLVPSMGSHGGATAEGQREMLLGLGFTPEATGCDIISSMDVTQIGEVDGLKVLYATDLLACDSVILANRVKAHTDIIGAVESGLSKMAAIGAGKHLGALQAHSRGLAATGTMVEKLAPIVFRDANIILGVAVLENSLDETRDVVVMQTAAIEQVEPRLLAESRSHLPRLLIHDIDVLVVDRMGKDVSGAGMDPNVLGRSVIGPKNPDMNVNQVVVLDLTEASHGNATGIGMAHVTTRRLFDKVDFAATFANGLTARAIDGSRMPAFMDNDRMAIQCAQRMTLAPDPTRLRIVRIPDTLHVADIWVSEALLDEVAAHPGLTQVGDLEPVPFDAVGNLL